MPKLYILLLLIFCTTAMYSADDEGNSILLNKNAVRQEIKLGAHHTVYLTATKYDKMVRWISSIRVEERNSRGQFIDRQIIPADRICIVGNPPGAEWIHFKDYNFDGILDIYLNCDSGATGNTSGVVMLYSPMRNRFIRHRDLNHVRGIESDAKLHHITMYERESVSESWIETYRWHGNRLRLEILEHDYFTQKPEFCNSNGNLSDCVSTAIARFSPVNGEMTQLRCYQGEHPTEDAPPLRRVSCSTQIQIIKKYRFVLPGFHE